MKSLQLPAPQISQAIQQPNLYRNINRMSVDPHAMMMAPPYTAEPMHTETQMSQMDQFPKDFYPTTNMAKKYSPHDYVYKHIYVTAPKDVKKVKKKKKKKESKEEGWFDDYNPFACKEEEEEEEEKEEEEEGEEEKEE